MCSLRKIVFNKQWVDKYPSLSPFAYCANNPVMLVDPDGREITDYRNLNGTLFHVEDGSSDVKIVLTGNNSQTEMQKAISNGEVVDMPCKSVLTTFDNIYTKTDDKNTEHYAAGDDFGNMSDVFEGQDGMVDAKTIRKARINLLEKGGEGTTWDVHSHNKSLDKSGKISDVGSPKVSENDKQTPNKFGVILGYGFKGPSFNSYGGDKETNRRIGFYNSKGQIGSSNGYNYEKFSNVVRTYGY
ncbi:MAG: hypothetical protein RBS19_08340 [Bacteroidales bacterium]|nr:hypothetical protein [Bacteroidales bacterium]